MWRPRRAVATCWVSYPCFTTSKQRYLPRNSHCEYPFAFSSRFKFVHSKTAPGKTRFLFISKQKLFTNLFSYLRESPSTLCYCFWQVYKILQCVESYQKENNLNPLPIDLISKTLYFISYLILYTLHGYNLYTLYLPFFFWPTPDHITYIL